MLLSNILAVSLLCMTAAGSATAEPINGMLFDDWAIECEQPPGTAEKKCFISQFVMVNKDNGPPQRLMKLSIGHLGPSGEVLLVAVLPLGISIQSGVAYRIDDRTQAPMTLQSCVVSGCVATAAIITETLEALERAKTMTVGAMSRDSTQTMNIPVSLKGFSAALASVE